MIISRLFLFIIILLFLFIPSSAFEDTFQYYPSGDYSSEWYMAVDNYPAYTEVDVVTTSETYSRALRMRIWDEENQGDSPKSNSILVHTTPTSSNYWGFNLLDGWMEGSGSGQTSTSSMCYIQFYDSNGYLLFQYQPPYHNYVPPYKYYEKGWWEFTIESDGDVLLSINGTNKGTIGTVSSTPSYIAFRMYNLYANRGQYNNYILVDDITTTGYVTGIGTESTSHSLTELNLNPMNISYGIKSFPAATYQAAEYKIDIKRSVEGTYTDIQNEVVKVAGNTSPYFGYSNWNRSADLTDNDTVYGLYMVYLTEDGVSKDTDYFFFAPPGDASSISFSDTEIPIGTTQTITYSIDAADFGTYNYYVRVYSTSAQVYSTSTTVASGTVSWDTTGNNAGLYFAVLSRTHKTSGAYAELTYDIATLSENIVIRGHAYDAQNETVLANVSVNFSQASIWYNTTTNATGYYELIDIVVDVEVNVNASLVNYTHENFTWTPLATDVYTLNLYLINDTPTYSNTTIGGVIYDYPLHQAVPSATVNIYNSTWSNTTTSSTITGFYLFEELTNGTFTVNATKTDFQDSDEYSIDTNNGSWQTQNILMYGIYELTIRAQDATTLAYLSSFSVDYNSVVCSTTSGSVVFPNLTYGLYTFSVSADGYYSNSEDILVGSTKTETIRLTQTDSVYYTPHYVKFTVQNIWGTKYSGVDVSVYEGSGTTTTFTGTTGSDGSATFRLYETTQYRITFINSTAGISETRTLYPVDDHYYIIVSSTLGSWDTYTVPISDAIDFTISKNTINSTHAYINVSYNDSLAETTDLKVYLNQTNESDYFNQTNLDTWNAGANSSGSYSFIVENYAGQSYIIRLLTEHTTYSTIDSTYSVSFKDDIATKFPGIPPSAFLYSSIFILLFTGGIFVKSNVEKGMLVICVMFFIFYGLGSFNTLPSNVQQSMLAGGILAFILSIIANLNKSNREEGFS
jgi:hypothetical protein